MTANPWWHTCRGQAFVSALFVLTTSKPVRSWGAWVAQSVERPTSAQVTISRFVGSSPTSGSVLMAQSLEPVSVSASPSHSAPPLLMPCLSLSLSLSLSKINKHKKLLQNPFILCWRHVYAFTKVGRAIRALSPVTNFNHESLVLIQIALIISKVFFFFSLIRWFL